MRKFVLAIALLPTPVLADDRGYLTGLLEDNLSGAGRKVVITGFAGALSSRASLKELTIADDQGVWLTLRNVSLDWTRSALLTGAVSVNELVADEIVLDRLPVADDSLPAAEAGEFALPDLPVSIDIGKIEAKRISLGPTVLGTPVEAELEASMQLSGGEGAATLRLERTDSGPAGKVSLEASYSNASKALVLDLSATEGQGGIAATKLGLPGVPSAALTIAGSGPISDYTAKVALATDGVDRLSGTVELGTTATEATTLAADLKGDLAPLFLPEYAEFFGNSVALKVEGSREPDGRMALSDFAVTAKAIDLKGSLSLAAGGMPQAFDLTGRIAQADGQPVLLPLTTDQPVRVQSADIALSYDLAKGEGWKGAATVTGLDRADFRASQLVLTGSGRIARKAGGATFGGTLRFDAEGLDPTDPALARALGAFVSGDGLVYMASGADSLTIPKLTLRGEDYAASVVAGRISGLDDALQMAGQIEAQVEDLSRFSGLAGQPLAGSADLVLSGTGSPLTGAFDVQGTVAGTDLKTGVAQLDGLMAGRSAVALSALRDKTGTTLRQLDLQATSLSVKAQGKIATAGSDLTATLDFADLGVLGAGYGGAMQGQAHITGTPEEATATLEATGQNLAIGQAETDRLLSGESRLSIAAGLKDGIVTFSRAEVSNPQLSVQGAGKLAGAQTDLAATLTLANLGVMGGGYGGSLAGDLRMTGTPEAGKVTLEATGRSLRIGQAEADKLLAGESRVSLALGLKDGEIRVDRADVTNPQLSAKATGTLTEGVQTIDLDAQLKSLGLILPEFPGALSVQGTVKQAADGTTLDLTGRGPGGIDASVSGRLAPGFGSGDLVIRGQAQAALGNAFIDPRAVSGGVSFDLRLNGPLALSSLNGSIGLENGRLADPTLPFAFQNIAARANLAGGQARIDATVPVSSGGQAVITGSAGLAAPFAGDLAIDLQRLTLRDPQLYETTMNGALTVKGPLAGGAMIAGRIALTETELRVPSTGFGGAGGLPDLRHVNEPGPVKATRARAGLLDEDAGSSGVGGPSYGLDVTLSAPNRLFLRGRGLDAELGGELRLLGTTAAVSPSGAFDLIRGRLDILGKRLDLTEARLEMQGELVPYIRVVATTENDGITSGVQIEGEATDPVVSFTSSPQLPQEEVLAQLLFGQNLLNLSALQALQLANAVATLAGRGGDGIVSKLRQGFGLDNLDVKTGANGGTQITAGKYLTKNVYSEVTVDQTGKSQINLNLDVSPSVTLRGRASSDGTAGVGVYLEKDY